MSDDSASRFNPLCARCARSCRQSAAVKLVECPRFVPYPFKLRPQPKKQLELFK